MNKPPFVPVFAAILAWQLTGCTSPGNPEARHVLQPNIPIVIDLPPAAVDYIGGILYDPFFRYSLIGISEVTAEQMLGRPSEQLAPNLWVYWRYYSPEKAGEVSGYDTLLVAFERGKVSRVKLVSGDTLRARLEGRRLPAKPIPL